MRIAEFSVKRRVTVAMAYLVVVGFGLFGLSQLKIDLYPDIDFPIIIVVTNYQGVGPEDVENLLTRPIEESVTAVKNVEKVSSQSSQGVSLVTLEFAYDADMDQAEADVRNAVDFIRDVLPEDATEPLVFAFDPSMIPVLYISVNSPYLGSAELRKLSEDNVEALLERVEGVASVQTWGGLERQINVNLNPIALAAYSLSPEQVARAVQMGGGLIPAGSIETTTRNYNLRVFSEYLDVDQVANTVVTFKGGEPIYVKEVADVEDGFKDQTADVRANYGQGVLMIVQKQSDANTVIAARRVKEELPNVLERMPEGVRFDVMFDQSDFITRSVGNLSNTAVIAFFMAVGVVYLFLRNWRGSVIIGVGIPVSIVATFSVLMLADLTLNVITMAGLALAIGMLVDNSIVVLENVYRHRELGESMNEASRRGAAEVGMAIAASTFTTISVFLPVLFVPDITGRLFRDMVYTIAFSLLVSLVVALTLVPALSSRILRTASELQSHAEREGKTLFGKFKNSIGRGLDRFGETYAKHLNWALTHRKTTLGIVAVFLVGSIGVATTLGGEFLPRSDQSFVNVIFEAEAGVSLPQLRKRVLDIEDAVRDEVPELESLSLNFGQQEGIGAIGNSSNTIEMFLRLVPLDERTRSQSEIQDALRERFDNIPGITYTIQQGGAFSNERDVEVKVFGHDIEQTKAIAEDLEAKIEKIEALADVSLNMESVAPELHVRLNKDMLNSYGLSTLEVAQNISTAIQGRVAARFREGSDEYNVYVQLDEAYRQEKSDVERVRIPLPMGGETIELKSVATIEPEAATPNIYRENQNRYVSVGASLAGSDLSGAVAEVEEAIAETPIPSDVTVVIGGTAEDQQEAFFYLIVAFLAAILLVYMIMASQFESLISPFIIMFTVPLSIIGVFFFLFVTQTTISVMALVGLVMLVGIAVNNGIVLVDFINQLRAEGREIGEAVREASKARMRPVLMTALTTILGMTPLAIELGTGAETWSPLARSVIGGMISTTGLTLLVIPVLYLMTHSAVERFKGFALKTYARLRGKKTATNETS